MKPAISDGRVLIVGGGVSGLTVAVALLEKGIPVTVIAREYAHPKQRITSQIAGALWEWPPALCGKHNDPKALADAKRWSLATYRKLRDLAARHPDCGILMRMTNFFFIKRVRDCPDLTAKMKEIEQITDHFRHDRAIIEESGVKDPRVVDAYQHDSPVIDTDVYLAFLATRARSFGGQLLQREVVGDLRAQVGSLQRQYGATVVVNCTGLAAKEVVGDVSMTPLRGALVRIVNDGSFKQAMLMAVDEDEFIFIVPRNDQTVIVGGTAEPGKWDLGINLDNYAPFKAMFERSVKFLPVLGRSKFVPDYPIAVGLRPFRPGGVRVEWDPVERSLLHNYGHGGSGYTLSIGCSADVVQMIESARSHSIASPKSRL